jgi:uncharacterized repeat protein (TIGR03803 family)
VFSITKEGVFKLLHSFNGSDGAQVGSGLTASEESIFYGTIQVGGLNGWGTVFAINPQGTLATLHNFAKSDGGYSYAAPIEGSDRNFYGTTGYGGENDSCHNSCGTVFSMTPDGTLVTLHSFDGSDGYIPTSGLLQATSGMLYGTTAEGGDFSCSPPVGCGTLFAFNQGLLPFVAFMRGYGKVGQSGGILGQGLTGTTSVTLNGIAASFRVVSDTYLTATIPPGATTGYATVTTPTVTTPTGTLTSNKKFVVLP